MKKKKETSPEYQDLFSHLEDINIDVEISSGEILSSESTIPLEGHLKIIPLEGHLKIIPLEENIKKISPENKAFSVIIEEAKKSGGSVLFETIVRQVREALGIGALHTKRRDAFLNIGVQKGLFKLSDGPKITLFSETLFENTVKDDIIPIEKDPEPEIVVAPIPKEVWVTPENWTGPKFLDCGHSPFWWGDITVNELGDKGKRVDTPTGEINCIACNKKIPSDPINKKGGYLNEPIPKHFRNTAISKNGWPGYCCDDEGIYIGGLGNNCRYTKPGDPFSKHNPDGTNILCVGHRK